MSEAKAGYPSEKGMREYPPEGGYRGEGGDAIRLSRLGEALDLLDKRLMEIDELQMALASDLAPVTREALEKTALAASPRDSTCPPGAAQVIQRIHGLSDRARAIVERLEHCRAELDL